MLSLRFTAAPDAQGRHPTYTFKNINLLGILPRTKRPLFLHLYYLAIIRRNRQRTFPRILPEISQYQPRPSILPIEKLHSPPKFLAIMSLILGVDNLMVFAMASEDLACGVVVTLYLILF